MEPPEGAGAIEVRLDALRRREPSGWFPGGAGAARPVIAACRSARDGGLARLGEKARRDALLAAARAGVAWVDLEHGSPAARIVEEVGPARVILSHHDRRGTPKAARLHALYKKMAAVPGVGAVKIVTTARDPADVLEIRRLLRLAAGGKVPLVAFAMGEPGAASRILALSWGSWATYVCLRRGAEAAPGQISLEEAAGLYRIGEIDEATRLTGLTGWPIGHSLSPTMHNAAYRHHGLNFRYLPFPAPQVGRLPLLIRELRIRGLSVTAPHKLAVVAKVRRLEPRARTVGAVNTILYDGRALVGLNTDVDGTLGPIRARMDPKGKIAAIAGAGGAARAAAFALSGAGAEVLICSRSERPGRSLARAAGGRWVSPRGLPRERYDILLNATPVGSDGRSLPVPRAAIKGLLVGDFVYRPVVTPLLRVAMERGIPTFDGLDVLLAQGVEQYAVFTGRVAPADVMRRALLDALPRAERRAG